ncbi:hypothetical protein [Hyphomicrobium methylovorum]|nr:hypothetical protein [Hyphomicrobium methylovorum]
MLNSEVSAGHAELAPDADHTERQRCLEPFRRNPRGNGEQRNSEVPPF